MPTTFDWSRLLQPFSQAGANRLFGLQPGGVQLGGMTIPNQWAGLGLGLAGTALDKEPGEIAEARSSVRNLLTPESQTGQFAGYVKGFNEQFQPFLTQQRQRGIADIQQKFIAAFPKTVGAQGPEFGALSRYITDEALPREQALLGELGLKGISNQLTAGQTLLETARPDPFAQALSQFGGLLSLRDMFGGGAQLGGVPPTGQPGQAGGLDQISQLLGQTTGGFGRQSNNGQMELLDQAGRIIGWVGGDGTVTSITKGIVGKAGGGAGGTVAAGGASPPLAGFAGAAALTATAVGSGYVGYQVGSRIGDAIEKPGRSSNFQTGAAGAASGAASGAATGAAIGSVIPGIGTAVGAVIGAIVGGISGAVGGSGAERRREDAQSEAEAQQTGAQRPAALQQFNGTVSSLDQLASQLSQMPQANGDVILSLMAQDPAFANLVREQSAIIEQATHEKSPQGIVPPEGLARLLREIRNGLASGPESIGGLLQSSETGRFGPGTQLLQGVTDRVARAQGAMSRILDAMRQKGVQV